MMLQGERGAKDGAQSEGDTDVPQEGGMFA